MLKGDPGREATNKEDAGGMGWGEGVWECWWLPSLIVIALVAWAVCAAVRVSSAAVRCGWSSVCSGVL